MSIGMRSICLFLFITLFLAACGSSSPTVAATASKPIPPSPLPAATNYPAPSANQATPAIIPEKPSTGYPAPTQSDPVPQDAYPSQAGVITITLATGARQSLAIDIVKGLPTVNANLEGKDQPYRRLGDLLAKAGATNISKATVTGQAGVLQLNADQVGLAYIDVQADGRIRILIQGMSAQQWPVNVSAITVQ